MKVKSKIPLIAVSLFLTSSILFFSCQKGDIATQGYTLTKELHQPVVEKDTFKFTLFYSEASAYYDPIAKNINPGDAGTDVVWDFSAIPTVGQEGKYAKDIWLDPSLKTDDLHKQANAISKAFYQNAKFVVYNGDYGNSYGFYDENFDYMGHIETSSLTSTDLRPVYYTESPFKKIMDFPSSYDTPELKQINRFIAAADNTTERYDTTYRKVDAIGTVKFPGGKEFKNVVRIKYLTKSLNGLGYNESLQYFWFYDKIKAPLLRYIRVKLISDGSYVYELHYNYGATP